jgi:hypothetical protein
MPKIQTLILRCLAVCVCALAVAIIGSWLLNYSKEQFHYREKYEVIEAKCENMGADHDLYYDNGNSELPVCRTPNSEDEWQTLRQRRAYREGLRSGDVDPDGGDPSGLNEFPY